jgi:hypothetical protein
MALNLWKIGGKPTSYNPLPTGAININLTNIGDYRVIVKARSLTNGTILTLQWDDGGSQKELKSISLTTTTVEYVWDFTTDKPCPFYIIRGSGTPDIIIDSIELVQKPLPKLTLNGVDGFLSGKWATDTGSLPDLSIFTFLDDDTVRVMNNTGAWKHICFNVPVLPNTTYVYSGEFNVSMPARLDFLDSTKTMQSIPFNGFNNVYGDGTRWNRAITTSSNTAYIRIYIQCQDSVVYTIKRPMLNLGSIVVPYSRKTGDKMVLPVAKKNLFNKDGNFVNRNAVVFNNGSVWNTGGVNAARLMTDYLTPLKPNTTYTISKIPSGYAAAIHQVNASGSPIIDSGWFSNDFTFTTSSSTYFADLYFRNNPDGGTINPSVASGFLLQLEENTSATAYEPYAVRANKKPMKLVPKKNAFNGNFIVGQAINSTNGVINQTNALTTDYMLVKPNTAYVLSKNFTWDDRLWVTPFDSNKIAIGTSNIATSGYSGSSSLTISTPTGCQYVKYYFWNGSGGDKSSLLPSLQLQLEEGSTATSYEPYTPVLPKARTGLVFDGVADSINCGSFAPYSKFTVEVKFKSDVLGYQQPISQHFDTTQAKTGWSVKLRSDGSVWFRIGTETSNSDLMIPNVYSIGEIVTLKCTFDGTNMVLYKNGIKIGNMTSSYTITNEATPLLIAKGFFGELFKGTIYYAKLFDGSGSLVRSYDFENPSNIVGTNVLQNGINLIPNFEDARWNLHANTQVLGRNVLRLNATGANQVSTFDVDVTPNTNYLGVSQQGRFAVTNMAGSIITGASYNNIGVKNFNSGNNTKLRLYLSSESATSGTFEFIRPQLYALSGNEGTLNGTPTPSNKPNKRILYNKR